MKIPKQQRKARAFYQIKKKYRNWNVMNRWANKRMKEKRLDLARICVSKYRMIGVSELEA